MAGSVDDMTSQAKDYDLEKEYGWFVEGVLAYVEENPTEFLEHYGVKGMKWGVRKDRSKGTRRLTGFGPDKIVRKTASGEELTLSKNPPSALHKGLARISKKYVDAYNRGANLTIKDASGKKVGEAQVEKRSDEELYLNWLGIDKGARGRGYATAVMKAAEEFGAQAGFKKMTLEVPGNSPDARHIYEKLGFKVVKEASPLEAKTDPVWGGLTSMEYVFDETRHADPVDRILAHYGVKGMKWGIRRNKDGSVTRTGKRMKSEDHKEAERLKKKPLYELSNQELRRLNERMQLEQNYKQLMAKEGVSIRKGQRYIKDVLSVAKAAQEVYNLAQSPAGKAVREVVEQSIRR